MEVFNFWLKFSIFKGVSLRNKWRNPKKKIWFSILIVWQREVLIIVSQDKHHENLEWWWKFSIFGWNSRFSKVLANEISDEIRKKIIVLIFYGLMQEVIIIVSYSKHHEISEWWWKFSIFCRNSRILKVLYHEISDEIPKKIKIFKFHGMVKEGNE